MSYTILRLLVYIVQTIKTNREEIYDLKIEIAYWAEMNDFIVNQ